MIALLHKRKRWDRVGGRGGGICPKYPMLDPPLIHTATPGYNDANSWLHENTSGYKTLYKITWGYRSNVSLYTNRCYITRDHSSTHKAKIPHRVTIMLQLVTWTYMLVIKLILFQKHLWCKKGEAKKVQVTEWLKGVKSQWGQEEKIYQEGCVELKHTKQVK